VREKRVAVKAAKKVVSQHLKKHGRPTTSGNYKINVNKVAKDLGVTVVEHDFSDDMSGVFVREGDSLFIGVNENHPPTRKRFTIAHEIGHFLLHAEDVIHHDNFDLESPSVVLYRSEGINSSAEVEANAFAAELLMPEQMIDECIEEGKTSIEGLAKAFNVSIDAMRYRLINLNYL